MRSWISGCLWIQQLSITITELEAGKGWGYARWMYRSWLCQKNLRGCHNGGRLHREIELVIQSTLNKKWGSFNYNCSIRPHPPFSTTKEGFPGSLSAAYGPGVSTISSTAINGAFVHKNKLVGIIGTYASCEIGSFLNASLNCGARELNSN